MFQKSVGVCTAMLALVVAPVLADVGVPVDLPTRARGAERVVVASIERVAGAWWRNDFGDQLIVSRADLRVNEVLKGPGFPGEGLTVEVEGGSVGDITLKVSDLPELSAGERAVFFLGRDGRGQFVPHLRGNGIMKVDANGRVIGTNLTLDDVRRGVSGR